MAIHDTIRARPDTKRRLMLAANRQRLSQVDFVDVLVTAWERLSPLQQSRAVRREDEPDAHPHKR